MFSFHEHLQHRIFVISYLKKIWRHLYQLDMGHDHMPGCNSNIGETGGVLRLTELSIKRPLQQIVCMLHQTELIFRHIFEELDGPCDG